MNATRFALAAAVWACAFTVFGSDADAFKVKREPNFTFASPPAVARDGDRITIRFETQGFCDATVAVEDDAGRILRHLASGLLGDNAPPPFQKSAKAQALLWDGKDDAGAYVDGKERLRIRVSLGLKPKLERSLFWHPSKSAGRVLAFAPGPEGMAVFKSGHAIDHLRLLGHDGNYLRTLYPFSAAQLEKMPGLIRHTFPDGVTMAIKPNWLQSSLLISGTNCTSPTYKDGKYRGYRPRKIELPGAAADALAVANGRVALVGTRLSRASTDGSSGGLNLNGPDLAIHSSEALWKSDARRDDSEGDLKEIRPKRAAVSPDGKWLYLTMYNETYAGSFGTVIWRHMVKRMLYDGNEPPQDFLGSTEPGKQDGAFNMPADIDCDAQGRLYVADHLNDRVQVFSPEGKPLKSIPVVRPARITVHRKSGELYVFSWALPMAGRTSFTGTEPSIQPREKADKFFKLTKFSPLDEAKQLGTWDLQAVAGMDRTRASNVELCAAVDSWSDPVRIWVSTPSPVNARNTVGTGIAILKQDGDAWKLERDLLAEAKEAIHRVHPAPHNRQRMAVNPLDGALYLVEGDTAHGTACKQVLRIDPNSGEIRDVDLPCSTEDMAFDHEGHAYLRTSDMILRYRATNWREVPFDYGEERKQVRFGNGGGERSTDILSGAVFPGNKGFHQGGLYVSATGHIVVAALYDNKPPARTDDMHVGTGGTKYQPTLYAGRRWGQGSRLGCIVIYVLDRYGKPLYTDAVPGLHVNVNGVGIDRNDDIYLLNASPRVFNGKMHWNDHAGTLMKFTPGKGRILSDDGAPVPLEPLPERAPDLALPKAWVEGAHWMYAGVGWGGHNYSSGCSCPNARFALDDFARSFTPEVDRYNVGVLDSNGNLILRVGRYGNVDDGMPLVKDGGPPNPHSVGGDETSILFAPYVATHTDRRLFIADPGNARIASVKLDYHTNSVISLKDVPDGSTP